MSYKLKLLLLVSLLGYQNTLLAAKRVALVIGNSNYLSLNTLATPRNDATAIAEKLNKLGFKLMSADGRLGNKAVLNVKEDQFSQQANKAEVAMVYYAGHGMQFGSESFLLPVDVQKTNIKLIQRHAISLEELLRSLDGKADLTIAVFDACREIPELEAAITKATRSSGLSKAAYRGLQLVKSKGRSRVIAYSGAAGQLVADGSGSNSTYTKVLISGVFIAYYFNGNIIRVRNIS
jgi:uncharacterized caspase-like protein